jgi:DNA invertase Pin-like site-specific DNA recombinase
MTCEHYRKLLTVNCSFCEKELKRRPDGRKHRFCNATCRNAHKRGFPVTDELRQEIFNLYDNESWSTTEIARYLECNHSLIYRVLRGEV